MSSSRKFAGRLFQTRGPATAKLLSPNVLSNVLRVRGTAHDLSELRTPAKLKAMLRFGLGPHMVGGFSWTAQQTISSWLCLQYKNPYRTTGSYITGTV